MEFYTDFTVLVLSYTATSIHSWNVLILFSRLYMRLGIQLIYVKHLHDRIISLRNEQFSSTTLSSIVCTKQGKLSVKYLCVRSISFTSFYSFSYFDIWTTSTVLFFVFFLNFNSTPQSSNVPMDHVMVCSSSVKVTFNISVPAQTFMISCITLKSHYHCFNTIDSSLSVLEYTVFLHFHTS